MNYKWNEIQFKEFIQLRDSLRAAKRKRNHQEVITLGIQILQLDKNAAFLKIVTPIFLIDIGNACEQLGDNEAALKYFTDARNKVKDHESNSGSWYGDIEVIERRLKRIQSKLDLSKSKG
jgi:hypothetical protein